MRTSTYQMYTNLYINTLVSRQMWRVENGFLEMFLAYYSQFEENVSEKKAYRDFLLEVLCAHEESLT